VKTDRPNLLTRIAYEGAASFNDEMLAKLVSAVAEVPIIVLSGAVRGLELRWEKEPQKATADLEMLSHEPPFSAVWVEHTNERNFSMGALISYAREADGWKADAVFAISVPGKKVYAPAFIAQWFVARTGELLPDIHLGYAVGTPEWAKLSNAACREFVVRTIGGMGLCRCGTIDLKQQQFARDDSRRLARRAGAEPVGGFRYKTAWIKTTLKKGRNLVGPSRPLGPREISMGHLKDYRWGRGLFGYLKIVAFWSGRVNDDVRQTYIAGEGVVERLKEEVLPSLSGRGE
jgi:hypothetical protein